MKLQLLILCFSAHLSVASALSSDGLVLLSLLKYWTFIPPSIISSWKVFDSTPCRWVGVHCDLHDHVVSLDLTGSGINGQVGQELIELKHLKNISLFGNQFYGVIPQSLGINSSLVKLELGNNNFTGNIPPSLCFGKQLLLLDLGVNQLQGSIPHDLGRCGTLRRLVLNRNNLTGSLPEFESNQNLIYVDISMNNISGAIPPSLGNCTNLTALILSMNMISGLIPPELGNLVNLQLLNLSHNNLEGPLPQQLSYCTKMGRFDVGYNFLNGSLPSSLSSWTGLTTLILSENHFNGGIPSFLSQFYLLLELQLGGNFFGGKIPPSIGKMQHLLYGLNLSASRLTGEIPLEIGKLQSLESLDVSLNNLTGSIHVLDELLSLVKVNISYNFFVGPVTEGLVRFLNYSPSSFIGNPGLCIGCSSCIKTSYLKPCENYMPSSTKQKHISKIVILVIGLGSSMLVAFLLFILIHIYLSSLRSRNSTANYQVQEPLFVGGVRGHRIIDLIYKQQVMRATENLNDLYIIGRGGHGIVYKAELCHFGVFAVKKLTIAGNKRKRLNVLREIEFARNLKHQYVARCQGSWIGKKYGLIFYKYMENGSLHDVLHGNDPPRSLGWNDRYNIAVGVAKGLAYLHHGCDPPILHRDIKPKNILLDSHMNPHITDFGIAIALNRTSDMKRMRSTYHLGTPGFMAPEIASRVVPSLKLDIYSYGVVLLELITGKKVLDFSFMEKETTLVGWFKSAWRETRDIEDIVDSSLARELSDLNVVGQVIKALSVALISTNKDPGKRLKMEDVIKIYEEPTIQGIFVQRYRTSFHLGSVLAAATDSIYAQDLLFDAKTKSVLCTEKAEQNYFVNRVKHDNDVRSIDNEMNTEYGIHMSKSGQQNFCSSDPYDQGKQLSTAGGYPHTGCASTSALSASNYPPPGVWRTHRE